MAGIEIRVALSTLLALDDHPGEVPGSGPVHAFLARSIVAQQTRGHWRYLITDNDGHLTHDGIIHTRPDGATREAPPTTGATVEIATPQTLLDELHANPAKTGPWAPVIADIHRQTQPQGERKGQSQSQSQDERKDPGQARRHSEREDQAKTTGQSESPGQAKGQPPGQAKGQPPGQAKGQPPGQAKGHGQGTSESTGTGTGPETDTETSTRTETGTGTGTGTGEGPARSRSEDDPRRRTPTAGLRRHVQIRDGVCAAPGCRIPATACDLDHIDDYANGGPTTAENLVPLCRHDHRVKHDGRWTLTRLPDGTRRWRTPNGLTFDTRPPPLIADLPPPHPRE